MPRLVRPGDSGPPFRATPSLIEVDFSCASALVRLSFLSDRTHYLLANGRRIPPHASIVLLPPNHVVCPASSRGIL